MGLLTVNTDLTTPAFGRGNKTNAQNLLLTFMTLRMMAKQIAIDIGAKWM